jgi:putative transcriptional regulator
MKNKLRELRMIAEISQQSMAERVGVSRQSIHAIEKGKYIPSTKLALMLCKELDKKVEEVFFLD